MVYIWIWPCISVPLYYDNVSRQCQWGLFGIECIHSWAFEWLLMRLHHQNFKIERNFFMFFLDIWFASANQFLLLLLASRCHLWKWRINKNLLCRSTAPLELISRLKYSNRHSRNGSEELQLPEPDTKCQNHAKQKGEVLWPYSCFGSRMEWANNFFCRVRKVVFHVAKSANGCDYGMAR